MRRWAAKQAASVAFRLDRAKRAMPVIPAWANAMAMCLPMPFDAPVTRTTFLARCCFGIGVGVQDAQWGGCSQVELVSIRGHGLFHFSKPVMAIYNFEFIVY